MKVVAVSIVGLVLCSLLAVGQSDQPVPPGVRKADKLPNPADVPPLVTGRTAPSPVDPAQLKREADELASLAQLIPSDIQNAAAGRIPQDLNQRLKRIEKLSKRLRREVFR